MMVTPLLCGRGGGGGGVQGGRFATFIDTTERKHAHIVRDFSSALNNFSLTLF